MLKDIGHYFQEMMLCEKQLQIFCKTLLGLNNMFAMCNNNVLSCRMSFRELCHLLQSTCLRHTCERRG